MSELVPKYLPDGPFASEWEVIRSDIEFLAFMPLPESSHTSLFSFVFVEFSVIAKLLSSIMCCW